MISTEAHTTARSDAPSRRLEEIRELEALWAVPHEAAHTLAAEPPSLVSRLARYRVGLGLSAAWLVFMTVLLALGPAGGEAAAPVWTEQVAGLLLTALLLAPLGAFNRVFGYGASSVAGVLGISLAVNCFTQGHTGFWSGYQLVGFGALAAVSVATLSRSRRSR